MEYRQLGRSDLKVSAIGLGAVTFSREIDEATAFTIIDHALERGINLIDTGFQYAGHEELVGKVLRSKHAHARLISIDTSAAEKLPGVKAVVTSKDILDFPIEKGPVMLGIQDMRWMCRNVMARDKALFHGHPVAAVAATSEIIAAQALKLMRAVLGG